MNPPIMHPNVIETITSWLFNVVHFFLSWLFHNVIFFFIYAVFIVFFSIIQSFKMQHDWDFTGTTQSFHHSIAHLLVSESARPLHIWVGFPRTEIKPVLCHFFEKCYDALCRHLTL